MMKRILLVVVALLAVRCYGQVVHEVQRSDYGQMVFSFRVDGVMVDTLTVGNSLFATVGFDGGDGSSVVGAPNLPTWRRLIETPLCQEIRTTLRNAEYDTLDASAWNVQQWIVPVQPSHSKSDTQAVRWVIDTLCYTTDTFYGAPTVVVDRVGVARDKCLAAVTLSPLCYNPVRHQIIVCKSADVVVEYVGADINATHMMKQLHGNGVYSVGLPLMASLPKMKPYSVATPVRMLIVSHSDFKGMLDTFVQWKRRIGYRVDVVYTDAIGTTNAAIRNYIRSQYTDATPDSPAPTYLLLVGDVQQIPAFAGRCHLGEGHITDLDYALWTDDDNIPDCYYGRFSAQTVDQLSAQLNKTLMYEQYTFPDPSFLDRAVLVAGVDQGKVADHGYTHADPTCDYVSKLYLNGGQGYSRVRYYKNSATTQHHASNVTVASNRDAEVVANSYNEGAGWINYSAHGTWNAWSNPQFTVPQVATMSNAYKFGVMIGNCCLSGKFERDNCFGEALMRKDNYCGAVAYIGASDYTYWNEDLYWSMGVRPNINANMPLHYEANHLGAYDRLFHTHGEMVGQRAVSLGALLTAGNMAVQSSSTNSNYKAYYWEVYHLFGDPSLMPWLGRPHKATVLCDSVIAQKGSQLEVATSAGVLVALTTGSEDCKLVASAVANDNGVAVLHYPDTLPLGMYELAVTGQHIQPHFQPVRVAQRGHSTVATKVYPMPATNTVYVECDTTIHRLTLYDVQGAVFDQQELLSTKAIVDISHLPLGIYLLRLDTAEGTVTKKVIKANKE